jgi:hypothetical protein
MNYIANKELKDKLDDIHRGLHITMEVFLNQKDYKRTEELLREVDFYLSQVVVETKVVR